MEKENNIRENNTGRSRAYQAYVTIFGIALWVAAVAHVSFGSTLRDQLTLLALVALTVVVSLFPLVFPMPAGLKFTDENMTFNLSDAFILLVACWYGLAPAVLIGGIEGFTSSRRAVRRLSSNLFSLGMLSLCAAAAAGSLDVVLRYGFKEADGLHSSLAVAVGLLVAGLVHMLTNMGLLSTLLALRNGDRIMQRWKANFLWTAPMFLPSSAAATLMYLAVQYNAWIVLVIGVPMLVSIYFGHRQYRSSVQERISLIEHAQLERIQVMEKAHRETIEALAVAINAKDEVTHEHVLRVQIYAAGVARILGCTEAEIEALRAGALLHDIGKIAVPDHILTKPGKLTAAEFDQMKLHTLVGAQILGRVEFPYPVVPIVRHHHERWDGAGYPDGLKGEAIPLTARILSVVDCFDAVREDRQYRKGMTREEAINFIMQGSGRMYDPRVVGTFVTHLPEFEAEIVAHRDAELPTFGIEPVEQLSDAARLIPPAAGLAETDDSSKTTLQHQPTQQEQTAFATLARALDGATTAEEIMCAFTEKLKALVPYDACAITLVEPELGESRVAYAAGEHAALLRGRRIASGEGVTGWVLTNRKPFCNTDPKLDFPPALAARFAGYRTLAVFPILKDADMHGAVALYSSTLDAYNAPQQKLLEAAVALITTTLTLVTATPVERRNMIAESNDSQPFVASGLTH
ncbi:MAG TPA: HD domain-containing phosphohydrolase [Pyrinomonadaceae bacterium]